MTSDGLLRSARAPRIACSVCVPATLPLRPEASLRLADKIGERTVRCEERDIDRYKRIVAICYIGSEDINGWLVKQGWALAFRKYSLDYVSAEDEAREAQRGVWRGNFEMPWEWRAAHSRHGKGGYRK